METIESAAIQFSIDNHEYHFALPRPKRHGDLYDALYTLSHDSAVKPSRVIAGFRTSSGRFVDRREGMKIARAANQLLDPTNKSVELYTEDLW